jgi:histidinol phosphatase-like enzyme
VHKKTVVFDFDGVIHLDDGGWHGADVIQGNLIDGVKETIQELRALDYEIIIVSARCSEPAGIRAIQNFLEAHGIVVDGIRQDKPPAVAYVDDRAICYRPDINLVEAIKKFYPWYEEAVL